MEAPRATAVGHLVGFACSLTAIVLNGPLSHDTGVGLAIAIVTLLGTRRLPRPEDAGSLEIVVGSVFNGGMRQGQFIKSCFAVALLVSGGIQYITTATGVSTALLGAALGISAIANEFEIRTLQRRLQTDYAHVGSSHTAQTD